MNGADAVVAGIVEEKTSANRGLSRPAGRRSLMAAKKIAAFRRPGGVIGAQSTPGMFSR
jgi:hypothetical protein